VSAFALAWRNLRKQRRRTLLMGAVVAFGFAAVALAGGFIAQSFDTLKDGTIRSVGQLQIVDRRSLHATEETTLEFGLKDAARARAIASKTPGVASVIPRIDFVGLATNGARSVPFLGIGVDPAPRPPRRSRRAHRVRPLSRGRRRRRGRARDGNRVGAGGQAGDSVTLMATTPDATLNAVDATIVGLADVQIKELNDRYVAIGVALASRLLQSSGTVSKLVVFLKPGADEKAAAESLERSLSAAGYPVAVRHWKSSPSSTARCASSTSGSSASSGPCSRSSWSSPRRSS
jgi:putative ABC transport system permease protein